MKNLFLLLAMLILLPSAQAQFTFTTNNGAITITHYNTAGGLNVVIPDTTNGYPVTSIAANAFFALNTITNVTIGTNVTSIGGSAFYDCTALRSVSMPNSLTNIDIEGGPFYLCTSLTNISVSASNPAYSSLKGVLFDKTQATLIVFPGGLHGSYTIPNSVTSIGDSAFYDCSALTNLTIPNSVTNIGGGAFLNCTSLTNLTIPNSVTNIGGAAFENCSSLTSVTIPNSVTSIGQEMFYGCSSLTSVTIPNSVTSIGPLAFEYCQNLFTITIPASVTNIGAYAFAYCSKLTEAYFQGNAPTIDSTAFQGVNNSMKVYHLPGTTGWSFLFGGHLTAITPLPSGVTSVGSFPAVFYPQGGTNYTLQMSTNPASGNWVTVSNSVVLNALQVTNLANTAFFRLQDTSGSVPSPTIVSYGHQPVWIYPTNATYSLQMKTNLATTNWLAPSGNTFISVQITNAPAGAVFRLH